MAAACSSVVGDTPIETALAGSNSVTSTSESPPDTRECLRPTGSDENIDTGTVSGDALSLSGELFICAVDVVVVSESDLNEVAAAAQLAAALNAPLLFPDERLAAEIGRLSPSTVHIVGAVEIITPPDAEIRTHVTADAVETARNFLSVSEEVLLPATPDASTIVETVLAIAESNRVALPKTTPSVTGNSPPSIDTSELISGLAVSNDSSSVWVVVASDPLTILLASAAGKAVGATVVAVDGEDVLAYPEVSLALTGLTLNNVRFIGGEPAADKWEWGALLSGQEVPGGGFRILPSESPRRYVAFYGHPETSGLGVLGEQAGEETIARMQPFLDAYSGDGAQTVPTFEIIATVASAGATEDGNYSYEWPISAFDDLFRTAEKHGAYIVLDLQPGRTDFLTQAQKYEEALLEPNVGLALDPEWRLKPDQVHLRQVGRVSAEEVNTVIHWLADLVRDNGLPQKMLILHQFRTDMIQNRELLENRPEIQVVIQMDGDGTEPQKDDTWLALQRGFEDTFWSWGWKNFFDEDEPGPPTPESTMGKRPSPVYVSYQ